MTNSSEALHPNKPARLRLLLAGYLPPAAITALSAVDPRVDIVQLDAEDGDCYEAKPRLLVPSPSAREQRIAELLRSADVLFTYPQAPLDLAENVPRLRWLQLLTAGGDELPGYQRMLAIVPITTIREARARPVAEYAIMLLLAFAKRLDASFVLKRNRSWDRLSAIELRGRTLGIVGFGSIGAETARLARAFGMRVIATRRTPGDTVTDAADEVLPPARLPDLLRRSDFVVLTAPSTPETKHLIGEAELRLMRPQAVLINVARGALVDEVALVRALREGWIAGAGLDVFEEEPLSTASPLYELDNVLLSCHSAGTTDQFGQRVIPILCDNLRRFLAGEPLRNQIDPLRGY